MLEIYPELPTGNLREPVSCFECLLTFKLTPGIKLVNNPLLKGADKIISSFYFSMKHVTISAM